MRLIKLDAVDSTNDFLRQLYADGQAADMTVVSAEIQTKGRGQMGASWHAQPGKNLTASVLLLNDLPQQKDVAALGFTIAVAVFETLNDRGIPDLKIKWPNDIMSGNKKLAGILVENVFHADGSVASVAGVGINVNQTDFPDLPDATSIALVSGIVDKYVLLKDLVDKIAELRTRYRNDRESLMADYEANLFRKNIPSVFELPGGQRLMGAIKRVADDGRLEIEHEDNVVMLYSLREIRMLL